MEILNWLEDKGFVADRSWQKEIEKFHSLSKGKFRIKIRENWDKKYGHYSNFEISFLDCEKEFYSNGGFIGWMSQKHLVSFSKEISKELFEEIFKHYNIN